MKKRPEWRFLPVKPLFYEVMNQKFLSVRGTLQLTYWPLVLVIVLLVFGIWMTIPPPPLNWCWDIASKKVALKCPVTRMLHHLGRSDGPVHSTICFPFRPRPGCWLAIQHQLRFLFHWSVYSRVQIRKRQTYEIVPGTYRKPQFRTEKF